MCIKFALNRKIKHIASIGRLRIFWRLIMTSFRKFIEFSAVVVRRKWPGALIRDSFMRMILQNSCISPTKCLSVRHRNLHRAQHLFPTFYFIVLSLFLLSLFSSLTSFYCLFCIYASKIESVCSFRFFIIIVENKIDYHNFHVSCVFKWRSWSCVIFG